MFQQKHHTHQNSYTDGSHLQPCQYQQQIPYLKQQQMQYNQQQQYIQQQQQTPIYISPQQQQQQQQQRQQQLSSQQQQPKKQKTNILNIYKEGKQKIIMSFYNLYRNYPTEPPSFSISPIWMMGRCYEVNYNTNNGNNNNNNNNSITINNQNYINNNNNNNSSSIKESNMKSSLFQSIFNSIENITNSNNSFDNINAAAAATNEYNNNYINNNNNNEINNNNNRHSSFLDDVASLIWFSYRKDFPPIENTNITTDIGWGCMLRTGQMILARALLKHLYQDNNNNLVNYEQERLKPNSKYNQILKWFSDYQSKDHIYGIHQIVHMKKAMDKKIRQKAVECYNNRRKQQQQQQINIRNNKNSSGKVKVRIEESSDNSSGSDGDDEWDNVEEWLAPTKISNVLRQLVKNDQNIDDLEMYVPSDGVIYREYINQLCNPINYNKYNHDHHYHHQQQQTQQQTQQIQQYGMNQDNVNQQRYHSQTESPHQLSQPQQSPPSRVPSEVFSHPLINEYENDQEFQEFNPNKWKSLIIMIPLKLGVDKINITYIQKLKTILTLPQSLGFIGGKPKQSFYFIGFQDDQIIYLDPHFVQDTVDPNQPNSNINNHYSDTFSGCVPQKMSFSSIDPSLSLGFYCKDKSSFDDLCYKLSLLETNDDFPIITISNKLPDYQLELDLIDINNINNNNNTNNTNNPLISNQNFNNNISNLNPNMNNSIKFGSFDTDDEFQLVNSNIKKQQQQQQQQQQSKLKSQSSSSSLPSKTKSKKEQFSPMYSHPPNFSSDDELDDFTVL